LTLPEMPIEAIENIVHTWQKEYTVWVMLITLITFRFFENKEVLWDVVTASAWTNMGTIILPPRRENAKQFKAYLDKMK
jgi:hypothetical protein